MENLDIFVELDIFVFGIVFDVFGGGESGKEVCYVIALLCEVCFIDFLILNFIFFL